MQKVTWILAALLSFSVLAGAAEAACKRPFGKYVGSGAGEAYRSGGVAEVGGAMAVLTVSSNGSWAGDFWVKQIIPPLTTVPLLAPAVGNAKHSFDVNTCRGLFVDSENIQYMYIVYDSGNTIQIFPIITDVARSFITTFRRP